jgi:hypothetical protein
MELEDKINALDKEVTLLKDQILNSLMLVKACLQKQRDISNINIAQTLDQL